MTTGRIDPDLEREQIRRDEARARGPGGFLGDLLAGIASAVLGLVLLAVLAVVVVIVLLVWIF